MADADGSDPDQDAEDSTNSRQPRSCRIRPCRYLPIPQRVQAVCNFVHEHLRFDYRQARADRTALEAFRVLESKSEFAVISHIWRLPSAAA
jgi:hypothetical protein